MRTKLIFILTLFIISGLLAVQNAEEVNLRVFIWSFQISLSLIIIGATAFGFLVSLLVRLSSEIKTKKSRRKASSEESKFKNETVKTEEKPELVTA